MIGIRIKFQILNMLYGVTVVWQTDCKVTYIDP